MATPTTHTLETLMPTTTTTTATTTATATATATEYARVDSLVHNLLTLGLDRLDLARVSRLVVHSGVADQVGVAARLLTALSDGTLDALLAGLHDDQLVESLYELVIG